MGTKFMEFPQTPRGRVSPYLSFITILSVLQCFGLLEALNNRLIGFKAWNRDVGF